MFDRVQLERQTRKQLVALARETGLRGYSRLRKAELVDALLAAPKGAAQATAKGKGPAKAKGATKAKAKGSAKAKAKVKEPAETKAAAQGKRTPAKRATGKADAGARAKSDRVPATAKGSGARKTAAAKRVGKRERLSVKAPAPVETEQRGAATAGAVEPRLRPNPKVGAKFTTGDAQPRGEEGVAGVLAEEAPERATAAVPEPTATSGGSEVAEAQVEPEAATAGATGANVGRAKNAGAKGVGAQNAGAEDVEAKDAEPEERFDLPPAYGSRRIFLTARDPRTLFAYWDFTDQQLEAGRRAAVDGVHRLRLLEEGPEPRVVEEVELPPGARDWYFRHQQPGARFSVHLGYRAADGRFLEMGASRMVTAPAETTQPGEETFVAVPADVPFRVLNAAPESETESETGTSALEAGEARVASAGRRDARAAGGAEDGAAEKPGGDGAEGAAGDAGSAAAGEAVEGDAAGASTGEAWSANPLVARTRVAKPPESPATPKHGPAAEMAAVDSGGAERGASPRGGFSAPEGGAGVASPSSWNRAAGSGAGGVAEVAQVARAEPPEVRRKVAAAEEKPFQLRVNAVIAIYGDSEPGARVLVNGHRIRTDSAGRFALHYALPDGDFALRIGATPEHGERGERGEHGEHTERTVEVGFSRRTLPLGEVGVYPLPGDLASPPPTPQSRSERS